jgi:hypothetical protein
VKTIDANRDSPTNKGHDDLTYSSLILLFIEVFKQTGPKKLCSNKDFVCLPELTFGFTTHTYDSHATLVILFIVQENTTEIICKSW